MCYGRLRFTAACIIRSFVRYSYSLNQVTYVVICILCVLLLRSLNVCSSGVCYCHLCVIAACVLWPLMCYGKFVLQLTVVIGVTCVLRSVYH